MRRSSESQYDNTSHRSSVPQVPQVEITKRAPLWIRLKEKALIIQEKAHDSNRRKTSRYLVLKSIWLICLLVSICFCTYLISETVMQYYKYDVTTKIRDNYLDNMTFPAITLCNTNPMGTSRANYLIQQYYFERYNVSISSGDEFLALLNNRTIENENDYIFYKTFDSNFNPNVREFLGFDWVFICMMKNIDCDYDRDFERYYDAKFGNCIRFNGGHNGGILWDIHSIEDSLLVVIFLGPPIDSTNLYDSLTSGLVISVNDQENKFPMSSNWISVKPGTLSQISLKKNQVTQMPHPYSNCQFRETIDTVLSQEMKKLNITYSRVNCFTMCRQKQTIDQIGCYDMRYPRILDAAPCSTMSQFNHIKNLTIDTSLCPQYCPKECRTTHYETSVSYLDMPTYLSYLDIVTTNQDSLVRVFKNKDINYDTLTKSFAGARIHFQEVKVTEMEESVAMSFVELVSNIGGTIGLFIEFSLMTCVEFIELMIEVAFILWKHK